LGGRRQGNGKENGKRAAAPRMGELQRCDAASSFAAGLTP
jgi:hypothetical protein